MRWYIEKHSVGCLSCLYLNDEPGSVHVRSEYTYHIVMSHDAERARSLNAHPCWKGGCWHPKYPKTQVTRKGVTDNKPVQLGIMSGWWMKGWWKQIKLCNSICHVPGGSPVLEPPLMHPEPLIPTKILRELAHIPQLGERHTTLRACHQDA